MQKREPVIETVQAADVVEQMSRLLHEVARQKARVVVEENGKPLAAIISAHDLERLKFYETKREEAFKALDRTREAFKDVPDEELKREIASAIAEVRAESRRLEQQASESP